MSFQCHACHQQRLSIVLSIELTPDSRSDEITLQLIACSVCGWEGMAIYEESRRGALDSATFSHVGYQLPRGEVELLRALILACPSRRNPFCTCKAHQSLGHQSAAGRWDGLQAIRHRDPFPLR